MIVYNVDGLRSNFGGIIIYHHRPIYIDFIDGEPNHASKPSETDSLRSSCLILYKDL